MMRRDRIASVLAREISTIVSQEIKDPRIGFVTITDVEVSPDLKTAYVYFSSLDDKKTGLATLQRAKGYIRSVLAHRVRIKVVPDIVFKIDDSYENRKKLDELFKQIKKSSKE